MPKAKGRQGVRRFIAQKRADALVAALMGLGAVHASEFVVAGSLRRKEKRVRDIDLLVRSPEAWQRLEEVPGLELTSYGERKAAGVWQDVPVDFRFVRDEEFGAALDYFTGPKGHNIGMRRKAKEQGYKLNEYGLFDHDDNWIAGDTEQSIYTALGHPWKPPEQRGK